MTLSSIFRASILALLLAVLPISVIACPCSEPTTEEPETTQEDETQENG